MKINREIEIRFKADSNILDKIKDIPMTAHTEVDEYFFTQATLDRDIYLRFRKRNNKIMLELKEIIISAAKSKDCHEADETEIELSEEQYNATRAIFNIVFPIKWVVKKIRRKGTLNGCEVCHDSVEGLGEFVEFEGPREKILEICRQFAFDIENREQFGCVKDHRLKSVAC